MAFAAPDHWQVYDETGRRKYVNSAERGRFLDAAAGLPQEQSALCAVLVLTGCRISEALALTRDHVDVVRCTITFRTLKRRRIVFRTVPVPESLIQRLMALPVGPGGRLWAVHRTTAWRWVRGVMLKVGIVGPMACCKGCRHGFGMHAAASNVPPNLIQRWLGHASPATTAVYLDAVGTEERAFACRMW